MSNISKFDTLQTLQTKKIPKLNSLQNFEIKSRGPLFHLILGLIFTKQRISQIQSHASIARYLSTIKSVLSYSVSSLTSKKVQSNIHLTTSKYYIQNATLITTQVQVTVAVFILAAKVLLFNTKFVLYLHKQLQVITMEATTPIQIVKIQPN